MNNASSILSRLPQRDDNLFTFADIAQALGVCPESVKRAHRTGAFGMEPIRRGRGQRHYFPLSAVVAALLSNRLPSPKHSAQA